MKKYLISLLWVITTTSANAACNSTGCNNSTITSWTTYYATNYDTNCLATNSTPTCFQNSSNLSSGIKIYQCASCPSGYAKTYSAGTITTTCGQATVTKCTKCTGCSNCTSGSWAAAGTGYEKRTKKTCDCNTCKSSTEYRCAKGYYGSSTNGTSGCTRCPVSGGVYGTTASAGSTAVTNCYLPSGTTFSDTTGSGTYTGNCYFSVP